jgi:hypothetical protein
VAFLLDPEVAAARGGLEALAARLASAGAARTDVWLACAGPASAPALATLAERLRARAR